MARWRGESGTGTRGARAVAAASAAGLILTLAVAGCSGDEPEPPPRSATVALQVDTVTGAESLDDQARTSVETDVGNLLSHYVVEAFLGEYPREDFVRSFDDFTVGAATRAAQDIEVLTGAGFRDADSVAAKRLVARLSLLAEDGDVIGASAKVRFVLEVDGGSGATHPVTVTGRLLLQRKNDTWSVFGYDVQRDDGAGLPAEASS